MRKIASIVLSVVLAVSMAPGIAWGENARSSEGDQPRESIQSSEGDQPRESIQSSEGDQPRESVQSSEDAKLVAFPSIEPEDIERQAEAQIVSEGGSNTVELEGGGSITVSKLVQPTGIENYFDVVLSAVVEETGQDNSTAVVLVMDVSNTMNEMQAGATGSDGSALSRLQSAQLAANQFIESYCEGEGLSPERQLGVVTFNTNAQWAEGLHMQTVTSESTSLLQGGVNAISAPSAPSSVRFTNMEAGLQLAFNALSASDAANKYVIFLTDGFPTTYIDRSIEGNAEGTDAISGYDPYEQGAYQASEVGEDGYFADAVLRLPCTYGTSYSDKAAERAEAVAEAMKQSGTEGSSKGINIFSVGIDVGAQTIAEYIDRATGTFSIVDRTSTDYVIGEADNPEAYAEWLRSAIAGGPDMANESPKYADGDSADELQQAFDYILEDIRAATGMLLAKALTIDPMGDDVEFQYFHDKSGAPASELQGENEEGSNDDPKENEASFSEDEREITWNLLESGYTVSKSDDGTRTFLFELSYRIRLTNEAEGFVFDEATPSNGGAYLDYSTIEPDGSAVQQDALFYPDPEVKGYAGDLGLLKTDALAFGKMVEGAEFELRHSDDCPACSAARAAGQSLGNEAVVETVHRSSAVDGTVRFANVPSGHEYLLSETRPAEGYMPNDAVYRVQVDYGQVKLMDAEGIQLDSSGFAPDGSLVVENTPEEQPPISDEPVPPVASLGQTGDAVGFVAAVLAGMVVVALTGGFLLLMRELRREDGSVV